MSFIRDEDPPSIVAAIVVVMLVVFVMVGLWLARGQANVDGAYHEYIEQSYR